MKQLRILYVVRHAKSSWDYEGTADIDRTLKSKGIRSAYTVSRKLKLSNLYPAKILSSPANRAVHTAVIFARVLDFSLQDITITNALYESTSVKILDLIKKTDDSCKSLMIFGHNPDFTDLVNRFLPSPIDNLPTAGVVELKFRVTDWKNIDRSNLDSHNFTFPESDE